MTTSKQSVSSRSTKKNRTYSVVGTTLARKVRNIEQWRRCFFQWIFRNVELFCRSDIFSTTTRSHLNGTLLNPSSEKDAERYGTTYSADSGDTTSSNTADFPFHNPSDSIVEHSLQHRRNTHVNSIVQSIWTGKWHSNVRDMNARFLTLWRQHNMPATWEEAPTVLHHFAQSLVTTIESNDMFLFVLPTNGTFWRDTLAPALRDPLCGYWLPNYQSSLCKMCKQSEMNVVDYGTCLACPVCHFVMNHPNITESTVNFGGTDKDPQGGQPKQSTKADIFRLNYVRDFHLFLQALRTASLGKSVTRDAISDLARKMVEQTRDVPFHMWSAHPWAYINVSTMRRQYNTLWREAGIRPTHLNAAIIYVTRHHAPNFSKHVERVATQAFASLERLFPTIVQKHPYLAYFSLNDFPKTVQMFAGLCASLGWDECISFSSQHTISLTNWIQGERVRFLFWKEKNWSFVPLLRPFPPIYLRGRASREWDSHRQQYAGSCYLSVAMYQPQVLVDLWVDIAEKRLHILRQWVFEAYRPVKNTGEWRTPSLRDVKQVLTYCSPYTDFWKAIVSSQSEVEKDGTKPPEVRIISSSSSSTHEKKKEKTRENSSKRSPKKKKNKDHPDEKPTLRTPSISSSRECSSQFAFIYRLLCPPTYRIWKGGSGDKQRTNEASPETTEYVKTEIRNCFYYQQSTFQWDNKEMNDRDDYYCVPGFLFPSEEVLSPSRIQRNSKPNSLPIENEQPEEKVERSKKKPSLEVDEKMLINEIRALMGHGPLYLFSAPKTPSRPKKSTSVHVRECSASEAKHSFKRPRPSASTEIDYTTTSSRKQKKTAFPTTSTNKQ